MVGSRKCGGRRLGDRRGIVGAAPGAPTLRNVAKAHFRILGIPIRVEPLFVVVAALFGIRLEPLWMVLGWMAIVFV